MSPASYLTAPPRGGLLTLAGCERLAKPAANRENPSVHADSDVFEVQPIGVVRSPRAEPIDDDWGDVAAAAQQPDWPEVGIYAHRAKRRPNRLGVSVCELLGIEGTTLNVRGLDAIDGTPVLDLKPYMVEFAPGTEVRQPAWSHELMRGYW
jgi:tRNA (Thr-GGU) A37 N-methylase